MKKLTLSVVVPVYNEEDSIAICLGRLFAQSDIIDEIIVVDNNSTDKTAKILNDLQKRHSKLKVLKEKVPGVIAARNLGFDSAKSELIARIDADTFVSPGWAAAIKSYFANEANKNVGATSGPVDQYDAPFQKVVVKFVDFFMGSVNADKGTLAHLYGANMLITKATWLEIKPFVCARTDIMEDLDLALHVQKVNKTIGHIKGAQASVSARRLLTAPHRYWHYQFLWPNTYKVHGMKAKFVRVYIFAVIGTILQSIVWLPLRFYNPKDKKFELIYLKQTKQERVMPYRVVKSRRSSRS